MGPIAHSLAFLLAVGLSPAVARAWLLRPGLRRDFGERLGRLPADLDGALSGEEPGEESKGSVGKEPCSSFLPLS